eukprot:5772523-Pyramimonas_sp.AAC.2
MRGDIAFLVSPRGACPSGDARIAEKFAFGGNSRVHTTCKQKKLPGRSSCSGGAAVEIGYATSETVQGHISTAVTFPLGRLYTRRDARPGKDILISGLVKMCVALRWKLEGKPSSHLRLTFLRERSSWQSLLYPTDSQDGEMPVIFTMHTCVNAV